MRKILLFILFFLFNVSKAYSLIEVDITRGNLNPLPIAVSPLFSDSDTKQELENKSNIIRLGDKTINYGRVLEIMGMLSGSGFTKVALISEPYKER